MAEMVNLPLRLAADLEREKAARSQAGPQPGAPATEFTTSPNAAARAQLQAQVKRRLDENDAARARTGTVTLIAVTNFRMVSDPQATVHESREVRIGEEFTVSTHDLRKYLGRGRPKLPSSPASPGAAVVAGR